MFHARAGHEFLTLAEAAALIRVGAATLKGWAEDRKVPAFRTPTGQWRFHRTELLAALRPDKREPADA